MGKSYSKQEEIIIAQNGANNADQKSLDQKLEIHGIMMASLIVMVLLIVIGCLLKKCHQGSKKWAQKQLRAAVSLSQVDKTAQQTSNDPYV